MKAVFVIDVPNELDVNDLLIDYCVHTKGEYKTIRKGGSHPLKPLPSFKAVDLNDTRDVVMFCHGWNTCLAEITGETE